MARDGAREVARAPRPRSPGGDGRLGTRLVGAVRRAGACAATWLGAAVRRAVASSARQLVDAALRQLGEAARRRCAAPGWRRSSPQRCAAVASSARQLVGAALRWAATRLAAALRRAVAAR
jgi:hypothetical protein